MTTAKERSQASARSSLRNGLIGLVFGVALMLMLNGSDNRFLFFAAGLFTLGALICVISSIVAVRSHR